MPGPIIPALDLAEDAITAALNALSPAGNAHFAEAPADTTRRMRLAASDPAHLSRIWIAQHQDNGGGQRNYLGGAGWQGEVAVRCLSADDAAARAGRDLAHAAMAALLSPAGYHLAARWLRPLPTLTRNGITQRVSLYAVTIRRVATP